MAYGIQPENSAFALLFNELHDPAFVIDVESRAFVTANAAAMRLLGYAPEELASLTPGDIHPHEIPRLERFLEQVVATGHWQADDLSCRTRFGETIPAEVRATAVMLDGRQCVVTQVRDLRGERLAAVGQSVRKLVHDLRNTLTTAQLLSDRLAAHQDEKVRKSSDTIARALERALELCRQTINAGTVAEQAPERTRFMLDEVVEEVIATTVLPSGVGPQVAMDSQHTTLLDADYDQVYRILLNLVRNAADAGAEVIEVAGAREAGGSAITVTDDGPGLPDFVRDKLAEEKRALPAGSSGLGLMIACELAAGHGGELEIVETGPAGSTLRVTIPDPA